MCRLTSKVDPNSLRVESRELNGSLYLLEESIGSFTLCLLFGKNFFEVPRNSPFSSRRFNIMQMLYSISGTPNFFREKL